MSLLLDVPLGVMDPQILLLPADVASLAAAEEAIELADAYGVAGGFPLDTSQQITLRAGCGERADGSWAASTVADFEPRQNGKNDTCNARELAGLVLFGERLIIHTAHEFSTANESFLRLVAVFEAWDDLRKRVARIRYANGEQGIELLSGQRLKYRARTGGAGRGFAQADLVVYDEAQHLQAEHVAASGPARLANPNSQGWYMGSGGLATSVNAWRLRRRALSGVAGRLAYVEHTAEQVRLEGRRLVSERPDVTDRSAWARANAAYGARISDESLTGLLDEMGPELFGRECMCMWDPEPADAKSHVFTVEQWNSLIATAPTGRPQAFAVDRTPDMAWTSIGVCCQRHVDLVEYRRGSEGVVDACVALTKVHGRVPFAVDPRGPASSLIEPLRQSGVNVVEPSTGDVTGACTAFADAVAGRSVSHPGNPVLDGAVEHATTRSVGDRWAWERETASPLMAVTLAHWQASLRKGSGKGRVLVLD